MAERKVGLLVGREWSFPPAFIDEVNGRGQGVVAEFVKLAGTRMDDAVRYDVIIDRISHEVPYYRSWLKHAVLEGATVVNNPFMWTADDKFFGASLASKLGIAHPKTVALPNREYVPGIKHDESLRNLEYPLDWDAILEHVGLPCILKDAHGGGWKEVYVCRTKDDVLRHYNESGLLQMILQEFIEWDQFIRCICIGREHVLPIRYDPRERRYHVDHEHLSPGLGRRIVEDSLTLVRALGYDMNSMEWAVRDGVPYAIDFMNPAPDMDVNSLTPHYFEWVVTRMADMAIDLALSSRPQLRELRWNELFGAAQGAAQGAPQAAQPDAPTTAAKAQPEKAKAGPKKPAAKETPSKPASKQPPSKQATAKQAPSKGAPKQALPKQAPGKQAAPTQAKQAVAKQPTSKQGSKQAAPKQASPKTAPGDGRGS